MSDNLGTFSDTAKALSRNPLGIIALFIVLVYAMAALVLGVAANGLGIFERVLLVLFLVLFPPGVLWVFRDLVIKYPGRLYSPGDFKDEENFIRMTREAAVVINMTAAAAVPSRSGTGLPAVPPPDHARLVAAARNATSAASAAPARPKILWVDDKPDNNLLERRAMEAAGFSIDTALSTDEAAKRVAAERFDVVISDMGRPEGADAGYTLLQELRASNVTVPYIIYSSSATPQQRTEAKRRGALDCTNDPNELLELVTRAIGR